MYDNEDPLVSDRDLRKNRNKKILFFMILIITIPIAIYIGIVIDDATKLDVAKASAVKYYKCLERCPLDNGNFQETCSNYCNSLLVSAKKFSSTDLKKINDLEKTISDGKKCLGMSSYQSCFIYYISK